MGKKTKKGRGGKGKGGKGASNKNRPSPKGSPNKDAAAVMTTTTTTADATAAAVVASLVEAAAAVSTPSPKTAEASSSANTTAVGKENGDSSDDKTTPPVTMTDDTKPSPAPAAAAAAVPENGCAQEKTADPVKAVEEVKTTSEEAVKTDDREAAAVAASNLDAVVASVLAEADDAVVPQDAQETKDTATAETVVKNAVEPVIVQDKVNKVPPQEEEKEVVAKDDDAAAFAFDKQNVAVQETTPVEETAKETIMSAQGPLVDDVAPTANRQVAAAAASKKEEATSPAITTAPVPQTNATNDHDDKPSTANGGRATPPADKSSSYESMIETPSPSNVKDLKSKLWDNKGLQVRVRPSVPADLQSRTQQLAPVPSPFKPNAATAVGDVASSSTNFDKGTSSSPSISVKAKAASMLQASKEVAAPPFVVENSKGGAAPAPTEKESPAPTTTSSSDTAAPAPAATSTDATGLSANNSGKRLARRKGPTSPKSILDRKALIQALDDRGIAYKDVHIAAFYQALHRQQYPDSLSTFVENFYKHENKQDLPTLQGPSAQATVSQSGKNRNKMQLPKAFLQFLAHPDNGFVTVTSKVAEAKTSRDQSTTKLAIELHDGQMVESVLMRYNKYSKETHPHRASLCISSQCGCAMGCTFCATGMMGLSGNLTAAEILEQIVHADRILAKEWSEKQQQGEQVEGEVKQLKKKHQQPLDAVRNVVFMGMGEPLDNYTNVVEACRALMDRKRWNLAHGRVTVSTVGVVSQMRKLSQDLPHVNLALSLHAPNQEMRVKIVPSAARYPIEELIDALDGHMKAYLSSTERREHSNRKRNGGKKDATVDSFDDGDDDMSQDENAPENMKTGTGSSGSSNADSDRTPSARRRAMVEYIMLEGETSTTASANELGKLCQGKNLVVNLIPYNATNVKDPLKCPSWDDMAQFRDIVSSYKVFCTIRRTMGSDIDSACGQLITLQQKESDIEDSASRTCRSRSTGKPANDTAFTTSPSSRATATTRTTDASKKGSDKKKKDDDDFDKYVTPLAIVTGLVATCFVASVFLRRRR